MEITVNQASLATWLRLMLGVDDPLSLPEELQAWENEGGPSYRKDEPWTHSVTAHQ